MDNIIKIIKDKILEKIECEAIVLFGSYARGTIGDGFRYEILISGKTIYCENELRFEFYRLDMYREYLELNESRQMIIEKMKSGGANSGKQGCDNK